MFHKKSTLFISFFSKYPGGASCAICRDFAYRCPMRLVLGLYVCFTCTDFFELSINERTFEKYDCTNNMRNCEDFKRLCDLCWFKRFRISGMLDL